MCDDDDNDDGDARKTDLTGVCVCVYWICFVCSTLAWAFQPIWYPGTPSEFPGTIAYYYEAACVPQPLPSCCCALCFPTNYFPPNFLPALVIRTVHTHTRPGTCELTPSYGGGQLSQVALARKRNFCCRPRSENERGKT